MRTINEDDFEKAIRIAIDSPLHMRIGNGVLELLFFRSAEGTSAAVPTVIEFTPDATGRLVANIKKILDGGAELIVQKGSVVQ